VAATAVVLELALQAEVLADPEAQKQVEAAPTQTTILEFVLANKAPVVPVATKVVDAAAPMMLPWVNIPIWFPLPKPVIVIVVVVPLSLNMYSIITYNII
jgi:hypothetical protein